MKTENLVSGNIRVCVYIYIKMHMCLCNACVYTRPQRKALQSVMFSHYPFWSQTEFSYDSLLLMFGVQVLCGNIGFCLSKTLFALLKFKRVLRRAEGPQE